MKSTSIIFLFLSFLFFACANADNEKLLFTFEDDSFSTEQIKAQDATYKIVELDGNKVLEVNNGFTLREAGVKIFEDSDAPWQLEDVYMIKADVSNQGDETIQVELFVGNDPDELTRWYCSDYVDLKPGEAKTITVKLAWTPWVFSPQLDIVGMRGVPGKIKTDLSAIKELTFCSRYAKDYNTFTIDNIRAVGRLEKRDTTGFLPFIDQYGQYKHKDWIGKIHSDEELLASAKQEQEVLADAPSAPNRSQYGGWATGPQLEATGFFRTEKYKGKWWMVDPEGYLFWTAGLNCVSSGSMNTGIEHRENYFAFLPEDNDELVQFYGQSGFNPSHGFYKCKAPYTTFNFYQANFYRKYGEDYMDDFRQMAHQRIKKWGMNTIGFMSDRTAIHQQKTPFVGSIWIRNTPKIEGSQGFWGKFHDVFDPRFQVAVRRSVEAQKEDAQDPWVIGYFVDNEMSWGALGSLAVGTLRSPASQAAKQVFIQDLKAKYTKIEALNKVWETNHNSWEALLESTTAPNAKKAEVDLLAFYEKIALTYFKTVSEELKRVSPNHNYLGCRFAWANNDIVISSAAKYMDIISFNKYEYSVADIDLPKGVDKPIMIGEFHFGALDRGSFHIGIKEAKDQAERGQMYQDYIQGALRNPYIVGAHWFQYLDESNTGRFDGENYNVGFVDVCDNPYPELIEKVQETTYTMYEYREGN